MTLFIASIPGPGVGNGVCRENSGCQNCVGCGKVTFRWANLKKFADNCDILRFGWIVVSYTMLDR